MFREYKDRAAFFVVYIQEAHASDGWQVPANLKENIIIENPEHPAEKIEVANACVRNLKIELPALLDDLENSTEIAYTGWPDRFYVIDKDGRIAHKSPAGPYGFKPAAAEQTLAALAAAAP